MYLRPPGNKNPSRAITKRRMLRQKMIYNREKKKAKYTLGSCQWILRQSSAFQRLFSWGNITVHVDSVSHVSVALQEYKNISVVSSSPDPWYFDTYPVPQVRTFGLWIWIWILIFSSVTFKKPTKNKFLSLLLTEGTFTTVFKGYMLLWNYNTV